MNILISRQDDVERIKILIKNFPVTAILGPRQCGKSTIANFFTYDHYYDLENPQDERLFDNPQLVLTESKGLIVIDEIQRKAELFPLLRYLAIYSIKRRIERVSLIVRAGT